MRNRDVWIYSKLNIFVYPYFLRKEYAKSNYKFLNRYQAMLFVSHGIQMKGTYVSHDKKTDEYKFVYVFEKNDETKELLNKFRNYELRWGNNIIEFELSPTLIQK